MNKNQSRELSDVASRLFHWSPGMLDFEIGRMIHSPNFKTGLDKEYTWRLTALRMMQGIGLYLTLVDCIDTEIDAECEFSVYCCDGSIHTVIPTLLRFREQDEKNFFNNRQLLGHKVSVACDIKVKPVNSGEKIKVKFDQSLFTLSHDFDKLFRSEKFSDVALVTHGKTFHAHKAVLSSRSSVFAGMFNADGQQDVRIVKIDDVDHVTMEAVLSFIYTSHVEDLEEVATDVLAVADKYGLDELKAMCEFSLYDGLTTENAIQTLRLADLCNAEELKTLVLGYIVENGKDVMETIAFRTLMKSNENIAFEIFRAVVTCQGGANEDDSEEEDEEEEVEEEVEEEEEDDGIEDE